MIRDLLGFSDYRFRSGDFCVRGEKRIIALTVEKTVSGAVGHGQLRPGG
jgi:hypothetical protein